MLPGEVKDIVIKRRFRGPSDSGNGGYVCGLVAQAFDGPCEVTLKSPPPLEAPLKLVRTDEGAQLRHGSDIIAEARKAEVDLTAPKAPSIDAASEAVSHFAGADKHLLPECFVCGPHRVHGDGLRIFTGPVEGREMVAAPWTPAAEFADKSGKVVPEILWAALDCPSYFALRQPHVLALLGRMKAQIIKAPDAETPLIAAAWCTGHEGRKYFADSALFDSNGVLLAKAQTIWIALKS